jgi:beta-N-acetylhexosaminidase
VRTLLGNGKAPIVVALRTPYDLRAFPDVGTYLCAYSIRDVATEAVARVLFGEIKAQGVLPCTIPGLALIG